MNSQIPDIGHPYPSFTEILRLSHPGLCKRLTRATIRSPPSLHRRTGAVPPHLRPSYKLYGHMMIHMKMLLSSYNDRVKTISIKFPGQSHIPRSLKTVMLHIPLVRYQIGLENQSWRRLSIIIRLIFFSRHIKIIPHSLPNTGFLAPQLSV